MTRSRDLANLADGTEFTAADHTKLDGIETSADVTDTTNVVAALTAGANITIAANGTITGAAQYTHPNHSGEVTSTADGATVIVDDIVDEANLKVSNTPTNGYFLSAQSGNTGGMTWAEVAQPSASDTLNTIKTVDGTGSGLDADLLDGQEGAYYAPIGSPTLTGTPAAPTASAGANSTQISTTAYVDSAISALADSAPAALNTLNELAAALGDDANYAATTTTAIGTKLAKAGGQMTGNITMSGTETVDGRDLSVDGAKLDTIETSANVTDTANVVAALTAGTNVAIAANGTISSTDTNTTYSVGDGGLSEINFTSADHTKLNGIATSANNYSFPYTVSTSESANTVAQRQANGYLHASYFNGSGTFATTGAGSGMGNFTGNNGSDTYGRSYNAAAARSLLNVADGANNYSLPADLTLTSVKFTTGPTLSEERDQNLKVKGHSSSSVGIAGFDSGNNWRFQIYGAANEYGFLDGNWAAWDLKKVTNGNLYLNDNVTYYLNPPSTTYLNTLTVGGDATFNGGAGAVTIGASGDIRSSSNTWSGESHGKIQYHSNNWYMQYYTQLIHRNSGGSNRMVLDASGNVTFSGNVTAYSDIRLKENIRPIENAVDLVGQMRGVFYTEKETKEARVGVIAQELEKVLPEVVRDNEQYNPETGKTENSIKSVNYGNIVGVLIEAIKELKAEVEELKK